MRDELPRFEPASKTTFWWSSREAQDEDVEWTCGTADTEPERMALCGLVEKDLKVTSVHVQLLRDDKTHIFL